MNDELLMGRKFHPWEGGKGKATTQYTVSLIEQAKKALKENAYADVKKLLEQALVYPENLGEGKLEGTKDNHIHYYLGLVEQALGNIEKAKALRELGALTPSTLLLPDGPRKSWTGQQ